MGIDPQKYRTTLGHYPTGVALVTAVLPSGEPVGMVVGTFSSVSLDPPLVSFLPMKSSGTFTQLRQASSFCINVLASDQTYICNQFTRRKTDRFTGIDWHPAPSGAPIIDGAVSWIDCTFHDILEGGDHYIVLGEIKDLDVQRPTLPLLFFQGGYGRFTAVSLVAPMAPDTIEAVRSAEAARPAIVDFATRHRVAVSMVAAINEYAVFIASANKSETSDANVGMRLPLMPPLGSVFYVDSSEEEIDAWADRIGRIDDTTRMRCHELVATVRRNGYSLSLRGEDDADIWAAAAEFASRDMTPSREREVRAHLTRTISRYEPELAPGQTYDVRAIIVPLPVSDDHKLALRVSNLPSGLTAAEVKAIAADLVVSAQRASRLITDNRPSD